MPETSARRARARLVLLVALLALPAGCNSWRHLRGPSNVGPQANAPSGNPTAEQLVAYLNDNARRLQSIECRDLQLDASMKWETVGLTGQMVCQKPRNFRLVARAAGMSMADFGSNPEEVWFWVGKSDPPYLFHCSHQDFAQGRSQVKFPLQPDWVMVALGMAEYDPSKPYQVRDVDRGRSIELISQSVSAQGRPVRQVTVFSRGPNLQVTGHKIVDQQTNKEICAATITQVQQDPTSGAFYPRMVQLHWPEEQMRLKMRLDDVVINNPIDQNRTAGLFTRPALQGVQSYNMAYGPDGPASLGQPIQRMGNYR
jgi:hypothetical protein